MHRFLIILLFLLSALQLKSRAQQFQKLEGKILAADTKEPVAFAAIGIPEKGIGTICDEAGNFEFKIPTEYQNPTICINALGYKQTCQPYSSFQKKNNTILLESANLQLATVEIKAISATELVKEAIRRMPENYADKPVNYTFYQRQLEVIDNKPAYIIESVNEAFRNYPRKDYQLAIRKSRGMSTSKKNREQMNYSWVAVYTILSYSDLTQYRPYLHPSKYKTYNYQYEKEELIGKDTVLVISFKPKSKNNGQEIAGDEGKLFLHNRSKAIIRIESKDNQAAIHKENNSLSTKAANKLSDGKLEFQGANSTIIYKQIGNRWYLDNVQSEGLSQISGGSYPIPENSHSITQLVVTNLQTKTAQEIAEAERVKPFRNPYSTAPKDMNEAYWQQYNVLPLPEAFKNLQAQ